MKIYYEDDVVDKELSRDYCLFTIFIRGSLTRPKSCRMATVKLASSYLSHHENTPNFDPLKPHFYIVKLGLTGVYIIFFLFLLKNIFCGYSLEPPR